MQFQKSFLINYYTEKYIFVHSFNCTIINCYLTLTRTDATLSLFVKTKPPCPFTQALMNVNDRLRKLYPDSEELFDIVLMTNNHAQVGVRLINSINHYGTQC